MVNGTALATTAHHVIVVQEKVVTATEAIQPHVQGRFRARLTPLPDDRRTYVQIDNRPAGVGLYSFDNLGSTNQDVVDNELKNGLVSFKVNVILIGPGPSHTEGVDQIHLGWLQDITSVTFKVTYGTGSASMSPMAGGKPLPPPWLDSGRQARPDAPALGRKPGTPRPPEGSGYDSSFTRSSTEAVLPAPPPGGGQERQVVSLDAPGVQFLEKNPLTDPPSEWTKTDGAYFFVNHLTAFSLDQPFSYAVLGTVPWDAYFVGTNDGMGNWVATPMRTKVDLPGAIDQKGFPLPANDVKTFNAQAPTFFNATNKNRPTYQP